MMSGATTSADSTAAVLQSKSTSRRLSALRSLKGLWKRTTHSAMSAIHRSDVTCRNDGVITPVDSVYDEDVMLSSMQFFKEERTDDAVYNVYLKKVQYHNDDHVIMSSSHNHQSNTDVGDSVDSGGCRLGRGDGQRNDHMSENGQTTTDTTSVDEIDDDRRARLQWRLEEVRVIKYGSLRRLVAALSTDNGQLEVTNVNTFLTTCHTFASTTDVVNELVKRYRDVESDSSMKRDVKEGHCKTIRTVIAAWLDTYPDDYNEPPDYNALETLKQFTAELLSAGLASSCDLHQRVVERLSLFRSDVTSQTSSSMASSPSESVSQWMTNCCTKQQHQQDFNANTYFLASSTDLVDVPSRHIAEQLTFIDAELFKRVNPQQCLGSVWSRRASSVVNPCQRLAVPSDGHVAMTSSVDSVATVTATINQFNAVTYRVIATILQRCRRTDKQQQQQQPANLSVVNCDSRQCAGKTVSDKLGVPLSMTDRAAVVEKWIDIAQECRRLKNFSSLKAILSGLQSTSIYRLRKVWSAVSRQAMALFEELSAIFSEDNNLQTWREVLNKEGTAKYATDTLTASRVRHRKKTWRWGSAKARRSQSLDCSIIPVVQGTVPYLGTFLTDLTMVDTAFRDTTEEGLINFDKRRREFEILTQIKLFQSAAAMYRIQQDQQFTSWFQHIPTYDDNTSYQLSCEIEPEIPQLRGARFKSKHHSFSFCQLSTSRMSTSVTSSRSTDEFSNLSLSSCRSLTLRSPTRRPEKQTPDVCRHIKLRHSVSAGSLLSTSSCSRCTGSSNDVIDSSIHYDDRFVVKVFMESNKSDDSVHYKSILLANSDHTTAVLRNILQKYGITDRPENFVLVQLLQDGSELCLPEKGNIYYAINTAVRDLQFVVRKKTDTLHL